MNDVFLSYHSSDRTTAELFADTLEAEGFSVWWDREIPVGKSFDEVIERELAAARSVVVLWSPASVRSRWVRAEASSAAHRDRLVPALIEQVQVPLEFRQIETAQLQGWTGDVEHPELRLLLASVREHVEAARREGDASGAAPPAPTPAAATRADTRPGSRRPARRNVSRTALGLVAMAVVGGAWLLRDSRVAPDTGSHDDRVAPDTGSRDSDPESAQASATEERNGADAELLGSREPAPGAFTIAIGDRVEEDMPGPGAGRIDAPFEQDAYTFTAQRGERVYFRLLDFDSALRGLTWALSDAVGNVVFSTCFGCSEPGVTRLTAGGRYSLTVGSDTNSAIGTYRFQILQVPPPSEFRIEIGAAIEENVPASGAGVIESPGAADVFGFAAAPGERVYFRMRSHSEALRGIYWRLDDADGQQLFETCLACGDPGVVELRKGGDYRLTVGSLTDPATGVYALQLLDVAPPQELELTLPARIAQDDPAPGAGLIESPGAEDVYRFTAVPGDTVRIVVLEAEAGLTYVYLRLTDDLGMELSSTCLACGSPGAIRLTRGGVYTVTVGNVRNPGTGAYALEITR